MENCAAIRIRLRDYSPRTTNKIYLVSSDGKAAFAADHVD